MSERRARILYTETSAFMPASAHFLEALGRLAARGECEFIFFDEAEHLSIASGIGARVMRRLLGNRREITGVNRALVETARRFRPTLVLIGKGAYFTPESLREVRSATGATLVNWATDDPFNPANGSRAMIDSIALYDLYVCTKRAIMHDVERAGCRAAIYLPFGYKPEVHFPQAPETAEEHRRFDCDAVFIGGADTDRAPWFEALLGAIPKLRLNLFGGYWNRYRALSENFRGIANGRDFRLAVGGAKIAINLVRRANRDDHVMRTFEIPACRGFMIAERTPTHQRLFAEDREAVFFSSPDELIAKVREWLPREDERRAIAAAGFRRITGGANTYDDRLAKILSSAGVGITLPNVAGR